MTTESSNLTYRQLRNQSHPHCVVCAQGNGLGLGLSFRVCGDGTVEATFSCDDVFQGYSATLHGGVICTLLDGAMTNCLFALGHAAVTAEMQIRFRHPVATGIPATVRGWITSSTSPLHCLAAELLQDGQVVATATGKFLEKSAVGWFRNKLS